MSIEGRENSKCIRAGLLIDGSEQHGVRTYAQNLLGALDRQKVHVTGIFLGHGNAVDVLGPLCDDTCHLNTGCLLPLSLPGRGKFEIANLARKSAIFARAVERLTATLRTARIDVLHVHMYPMHLVAGIACRCARTACLWHWHGPLQRSSLIVRPALYGFRHLATRIACISRFVAGTLPDEIQHKSRVIHNGVRTEFIAQNQRKGALRARLGLDSETLLIGLFGAIAPRKGHEYFIHAAAHIAEQCPVARCAIVGGENELSRQRYDYTGRYQRLADELGLEDRMIFAGSIADAPLYMSDCDLICMPTIPIGEDSGEGFGLVMIEAMSAGVPVIATSCGAPPEVIDHGINGILVPPRDAERLADAIQRLIRDAALRRRIASAGQERASKEFDVSRMAQQIERLYDECVQHTSHSATELEYTL